MRTFCGIMSIPQNTIMGLNNVMLCDENELVFCALVAVENLKGPTIL